MVSKSNVDWIKEMLKRERDSTRSRLNSLRQRLSETNCVHEFYRVYGDDFVLYETKLSYLDMWTSEIEKQDKTLDYVRSVLNDGRLSISMLPDVFSTNPYSNANEIYKHRAKIELVHFLEGIIE